MAVIGATLLPLFAGCGFVGFELQAVTENEPDQDGDGRTTTGGQPQVPATGGQPQVPTTGGATSGGSTQPGGAVTTGGAVSPASGGEADAGNPSCELGTVDHCAACDEPCLAADVPGTVSVTCQFGRCAPLACAEGFADCDGVPDNGCEADLASPEHCGQCGNTCVGDYAVMGCNMGACQVVACESGFDDCDGEPGNGCERALTTLTDCGACGVACAADAAVTDCGSGTCQVTACMPGFDDCDGDPLGNGCETSLSTLSDCSACGVVCSVTAGTASCAGGTCTGAGCDGGFADCDGDSLSCETSLSTLTDCGACDAPCGIGGRLANASATCATGNCAVDRCDASYRDCDGQAGNGCETSIRTLSDCGSCGQGCSAAHATTSCASGSCTIASCQTGYRDCRNGVSDGCETDITTTANCGACGRTCAGSAQCIQGDCVGYTYVTTNFPESSIDAGVTNAATFNCGTTTFDSSTRQFSNACGNTTPATRIVTQSGGADLVVVSFRSLTVASGSSLRLIGNRPVVLAVTTDVTISGTLEVSASGTTPGAGGNVSCGSSAGGNGGGSSSSGGGGGGGAGFGTIGGRGGQGDGASSGNGGATRGADSLAPLLGGCGGGYGGGCSGNRGAGGGAVQISSGGTLRVSGTVRANGSSGTNGCGSEGGGTGGGSGGGILLEARDLIVSGTLQANGGNGGNGAGGGSGGLGGTSSRTAQVGNSHHINGGGGGGGAVGRIRLRGQNSCSLGGGNMSPSASLSCP